MNLSDIFGYEIKVNDQPRLAERQYSGFPGIDGLTTLYLGTRGRPIIITGRLVRSGSNYNNARANVRSQIEYIESLYGAAPNLYVWAGSNYYNTIIEKIEIIPDSQGKSYHFNASGDVWVDFVATLRQLL